MQLALKHAEKKKKKRKKKKKKKKKKVKDLKIQLFILKSD